MREMEREVRRERERERERERDEQELSKYKRISVCTQWSKDRKPENR